MRRGITLSLVRSVPDGPGTIFNRAKPSESVPPKQDSHFDPTNRSRALDPLEAFEAIRLDLTEWFDLTRPGNYHLGMEIAAESGIGEGSSSLVYFDVGEAE
jgi:hypothetical protein